MNPYEKNKQIKNLKNSFYQKFKIIHNKYLKHFTKVIKISKNISIIVFNLVLVFIVIIIVIIIIIIIVIITIIIIIMRDSSHID